MVGNGMGAKNGIMFKTAVSLEETGKMEIVALDKTGTITNGEPKATDILPAEGISEQELLELAASLEQKSEHPLAKAVLDYAKTQQINLSEVTGFQALPGNGLSGKWKGTEVSGGNFNFISSRAEIPAALKSQSEQLAEEGKTPLFFAKGGQAAGMIAVADVMKEDSAAAIRELKQMGIQ